MNRFFLPVINRTKEMSSQSNQEIKLFNFAEQYFRNNRYSHGDDSGKLCNRFYIHKPKMEDCGNYYLLSDFTVSHENYIENTSFIISMDEKVNVKIRMNKNKTSNEYYQRKNHDEFSLYVDSTLKYYNGYPYYPMGITSNKQDSYLTELKRLVELKDWGNNLSKYYNLVDPSLTPEKIQELQEELQEKIIEFKDFVDNYLLSVKKRTGYYYDMIFIHKPKMEDCGNYYLLSDFTVSYKYKTRSEKFAPCKVVFMDEDVNVKIKMDKSDESNKYYNKTFKKKNALIHVLIDYKQGNNHYDVRACTSRSNPFNGVMTFYLTELKRLVAAEKWGKDDESQFYYLVDPSLTPEKIKQLEKEKRPKVLEKLRKRIEKNIYESLLVGKPEFHEIIKLCYDIINDKIGHLTISVKKILLSYVSEKISKLQSKCNFSDKILAALDDIEKDIESYIIKNINIKF